MILQNAPSSSASLPPSMEAIDFVLSGECQPQTLVHGSLHLWGHVGQDAPASFEVAEKIRSLQ